MFRAIGTSGLLAWGLLLGARDAAAQACCAGAGAITPARLDVHDRYLAGVTLKGAALFGSFGAKGAFTSTPGSVREYDFEQDLFAAVRVLRRGQVSVLLPILETYRGSGAVSEGGGGVGDLNLAARYDLVRAREARYVPGIGLLAGVTFPTGRPPEASFSPLATDATGLGAVQGNGGLAVEQTFGAFVVGVSGVISARAGRSFRGVQSTLAPQVTTLASVAYVFPEGASMGLSTSYTVEGDAQINQKTVAESGRRLLQTTLSGVWPASEKVRLVGSVSVNPPLSRVNANQPAAAGVALGVIFSSF